MNYVTDTHSLVWYFTEESQLSETALAAFEETIEAGSIIVPTIVLAEVMYICQKGRVPLTFSETLARLEEYDNFEIVPLDIDILRMANNISVDLEMHDKLIVATALYFDMPLITKDEP
jgi:PIN domain nuclease of toxin-antitoxin system